MGNNTVHSILKTPTEPDPSEWLTPERRQLIMEQTANIRPLLVQAGLWRATLGYWVRWQASLEANWSKDDEQKSIEQLLEKWQKDHTNDENSGLNTETLKEKLRVTPAVSRWSHDQWSHLVDSLYLKAKGDLDQASCRLLRIKNKSMANELYFRIKANETSFEQAAREYGEGPERKKGGLISLQPLKAMPFGLAPLLQQLEVGKISQPLKLGKIYCLVQLEEFRPSQLDEKTRKALLRTA